MLSQGWPHDGVVHFNMAMCDFSATARISCWSLSADCSELSVNQIAHIRINVSRDLKLFGGEIIFKVFQPIWSQYLNVTDGQTDGRCTVASLCGKYRETKSQLKIPVYRRFKKPTWTITRPIHTPTGRTYAIKWNIVKCFTERRWTSCIRQCGYKIWRANYSHLHKMTTLQPCSQTKWCQFSN